MIDSTQSTEIYTGKVLVVIVPTIFNVRFRFLVSSPPNAWTLPLDDRTCLGRIGALA
jgi:hypothetical protein